jgi:mannosyltransferase
MTHRHRYTLFWLLALLMAFGLRLALYDFHGLEGDDAFSLALARYELGALLAGLARQEIDIHPPLHFLALKGWTTLAGESLIALRLMNILADTLSGALLIRLAGRVFGRRAVLAAGGLWLLAPLLIYATWLIRMYSLLALFTAGGALCIAQARGRRRALWYAGAALCGLLAAWTHLVGGLALAGLLLALLVDWLHSRRDARMLAAGLGVFGLAGALYLPYFGAVWALYQSGRPLGADIAEASFADPLSALAASLGAMLAHRVLDAPLAGLLLAMALAAGSAWLWRRDAARVAPLLMLLWAGLLGMAGLAWVAGMYKARYLAAFVPPLLAVMAGLVVHLPRRWPRVVSGLLLAGLIIISLGGLLGDLRRNFRDDWTAAAAFIRQHERPGDAIIVIPDWGQEALRFHYDGAAEITGVLPQVSADVDLGTALGPLAAGRDRVWLVSYQPLVSDPDGLAPAWLDARCCGRMTEAFPAGMHIRYYSLRAVYDRLPADARPLDAVFSGRLALRGVYLPVTRGSARDTRLHPPSNWVHVVLYWEGLADGGAYPRVRLADVYGQVWGEALRRGSDVMDRASAEQWQPGELWEIPYDINLNPDTAPGVYHIEVMALDDEGRPWDAQGADAGDFWVIAGEFVVE